MELFDSPPTYTRGGGHYRVGHAEIELREESELPTVSGEGTRIKVSFGGLV